MMKKLEKTTDVRYLMPSHMPSYLRIDKDVKESLITLATLTKQYSSFDVLALEREVSRTLELELDRQSAEYKRHKRQTEKRLIAANQKLEECSQAKEKII